MNAVGGKSQKNPPKPPKNLPPKNTRNKAVYKKKQTFFFSLSLFWQDTK